MQDLKQAIKSKDLNKINQILSLPNAKSIINQPDKQLQTALFHAGLHEDEDFGLIVVNMLLEHGADPYHKQENKETVIYYLAGNNKLKILERMLELGYNLNENDNFGWTPLFFAASKGRLKSAELLIKNGCDVNHVDLHGQTSLFWAASTGHLQMCKQLINRGCNPLALDKSKKTAATLAKNHHHNHIADYLNTFKKQKQKFKASNSQSLQMEKKGKKKQTIRNQYFLVYTGDDGHTKPLSYEQAYDFLNKNSNIKQLIQNYNQLQALNPSQSSVYRAANKIISTLLKRQDTLAFHEPVRYEQLKLLDYPKIVTEPMDYSTMKHKLNYNAYKSEQDFTKDMHLVYDNCIKYNGPQSDYGKLALKIKQEYDSVLVKEFQI